MIDLRIQFIVLYDYFYVVTIILYAEDNLQRQHCPKIYNNSRQPGGAAGFEGHKCYLNASR